MRPIEFTDAMKLHAELVDAERAFAIYSHPASAARPMLAWVMLPLGLTIRQTIKLIMEKPLEIEPDDEYATRILMLQARRQRARAAWAAHEVELKHAG